MNDLDFWALFSIIAKFLVYASWFTAFGISFYRLIYLQAGSSLWLYTRNVLYTSLPLGLFAVIAHFFFQVGGLSGGDLMDMFDGDMMSLMWEASAGTALALKIIAFALLSSAILVPIRLARIIVLASTVLFAASFTVLGHANNDTVLRVLLSVHIIGVTFWIGALWPLHKAAMGAVSIEATAKLAHRFGQAAQWVVVGLIIAGLLTAILLLGSPLLLITTDYGRVLLLKIIIVGGLMGLAVVNKLRLTPAMLNNDRIALQKFALSVRIELMVVALILAITAVLTSLIEMPEGH